MTYDGKNNLLSQKNADNKQITLTYDSKGNLTEKTDPLGNTTTYSYDGSGLLIRKITPAPNSGTTSYTYLNGLLQTITDPVGNRTTYGRDPAGRITAVTDAAAKKTTMTYDAADNLTSVTDPLGNKVSYSYDWRNNILAKTDARGSITSCQYDGNGNLTGVLDALGNTTSYQYDSENRLVKMTDARGNSTMYTYDPLDRLTGITDPSGVTTGYQYDTLGHLTGKTDALGKRLLSVNYDALGNPTAVTDALGNTAESEYDSLSRPISVTDPLNNITRLDYDALNRHVSTTDPMNGQGKQYFDSRGYRTTVTDPNNNSTGFTYDPAGRLTGKTFASNGVNTFRYNNRNLLDSRTDARGRITTFQYDSAGRLVSYANPDGTVSCTYDQNGNIRTVTDSTGTAENVYDTLNRVTSYKDTQGNIIQYAYDSVGNLITLTYPGGRQVSYEYDTANRMKKVTDWGGRVTSYSYDQNGRLIKTDHPNGTATILTYNDNGQPTQLKDIDKNGSVISRYDLTYDVARNIIDDNNTYETANINPNNAQLTYTSDNRLETYNGQTVEYDAEGNMTKGPLNGQLVVFNYDTKNRLVGVGDTQYTYDARSNRILTSEGSNQTSYIINPVAQLSQVLIKKDSQNQKTYYVYGLGLIGHESPDGTYRAYHYDYRGNTIALTDQSGQVTDRISYSVFGEIRSRAGNTPTPFLFSGIYGIMTDSNGLYYMRARYYNLTIGRFISRDSYEGKIINPLSLNLYAYCNNNPVNNVDPTGHIPVETVADFVSIGCSAVDLRTDPSWTNLGYLAWDLGATLVPYAPGSYVAKGAKAGGKLLNNADEVIEGATKTDFFVTPKGDIIPATKEGFNNNLSEMTEQNGKYVGESSNGPVRVRVEDAHPEKPGYSGHENPDHEVPHVHIEHKQNGATGQWGRGDPSNITTFPQDWLY